MKGYSFDEWPTCSGQLWHNPGPLPATFLPPPLSLQLTSYHSGRLSLSALLLRDYWVYIYNLCLHYHWTVKAVVGTASSFRSHLCVRLASDSLHCLHIFSLSHISLFQRLLSLLIILFYLFLSIVFSCGEHSENYCLSVPIILLHLISQTSDLFLKCLCLTALSVCAHMHLSCLVRHYSCMCVHALCFRFRQYPA